MTYGTNLEKRTFAMQIEDLYRLSMVRGKRTVLIGWFPSEYRAKTAAGALEWDRSWKPIIEHVDDCQREVRENPIAGEQHEVYSEFHRIIAPLGTPKWLRRGPFQTTVEAHIPDPAMEVWRAILTHGLASDDEIFRGRMLDADTAKDIAKQFIEFLTTGSARGFTDPARVHALYERAFAMLPGAVSLGWRDWPPDLYVMGIHFKRQEALRELLQAVDIFYRNPETNEREAVWLWDFKKGIQSPEGVLTLWELLQFGDPFYERDSSGEQRLVYSDIGYVVLDRWNEHMRLELWPATEEQMDEGQLAAPEVGGPEHVPGMYEVSEAREADGVDPIQLAVETFGVTDNLNYAAYILPDGRFLNREREALGSLSHDAIAHTVMGGGPDPVGRFLETGVVRVATARGQVALELRRDLTAEQREALLGLFAAYPTAEVVMEQHDRFIDVRHYERKPNDGEALLRLWASGIRDEGREVGEAREEAQDYVDVEGKWQKEYAIAPRFAPAWLKIKGADTDIDWSHRIESDSTPPAVVSVHFPGGYDENHYDNSPEAVHQREQSTRDYFLTPRSVLQAYKDPRQQYGITLDATGIRHDGSIVSWYDLDGGFVRFATLWDLAHVKQGVPQNGTIEGLITEEKVSGDEEHLIEMRIERLRGFLNKPLWLLSEAQWDNAEYPPPIEGGPPYAGSATVERRP